jgi:hypothetical protein
MGRARTHGARIFAAPTKGEEEEDPTCNSEKLRTVIEEVNKKNPLIIFAPSRFLEYFRERSKQIKK